MLSGALTVTSVDPVSGEELASGELVIPGVRSALPVRGARGESLTSRAPELAARIAEQVRALDREHGGPIRARFELDAGRETLTEVEAAPLAPLARVRVLVERVRGGRLTRAEAIARLDPADLEATGVHAIRTPAPAPFARGLPASAGAAAGRLSLPEDLTGAPGDDPRVLVIDDASPEDARALRLAVAIVATSGGLTADAAIAARALRKPCVVSAGIRLGDRAESARGAWVTVDGGGGGIHPGRLDMIWQACSPFARELVEWLSPSPGEAPGTALARARGTQALGG